MLGYSFSVSSPSLATYIRTEVRRYWGTPFRLGLLFVSCTHTEVQGVLGSIFSGSNPSNCTIQRVRGAMLVHPRPMCPRPKILGCCILWTKCPLAILPLTEPSLPFDLTERSDTRLPTAARFRSAKWWSSMCGPSVHPTEGCQSNKPGQGRRRSRPNAPLIH